MALLCCVSLMGLVPEESFASIAFVVFAKCASLKHHPRLLHCRYLQVVRRIQREYKLEPAGSHGVWGLDDFQFLPYLWGASQLIGPALRCRWQCTHGQRRQHEPAARHDWRPRCGRARGAGFPVLRRHQVHFPGQRPRLLLAVTPPQMKSGPFAEHSRYLYDISGVPEWTKVNSGLVKMYKEEVLHKFPVIQHFLFGSLLQMDSQTGPAAHQPAAELISTVHPALWKQPK